MDPGDVGGYSYTWDTPTAVTTAVDLWEFLLNDTAQGRVGGLMISQTSDLGDAQHEVLNMQYVTGNTTSGSGGGTPDAQIVGAGGYSGVTTAECRNTTAASGGSPNKGIAHGWNVLSPFDMWYPNGLEPWLSAAFGTNSLTVLRLLAAPADSLTLMSSIYLRGGALYAN